MLGWMINYVYEKSIKNKVNRKSVNQLLWQQIKFIKVTIYKMVVKFLTRNKKIKENGFEEARVVLNVKRVVLNVKNLLEYRQL